MESTRLSGVRVLVIGGGGAGIGRAVVRRLAAEGARVGVADIDAEQAAHAAQEAAHGHPPVALPTDVRDPEQLRHMIDGAIAGLEGLDAVVTVVGGQVAFVPTARLHEMRDEDWDTIYEVNLRYVFRVIRLVLPHFREQREGAIVSVGSVTGITGAPGQGAYGVMKAGLASLARTVGAEYAGEGIRMNVVAGGAISTKVANAETDEWIDEIPMGRTGSVEEIAGAVAYLFSGESRYMTGQQVVLDGGVTSRGPFE